MCSARETVTLDTEETLARVTATPEAEESAEGPLRTRPQWRCSHGRMRAIRPTRRPRVLRKVPVAPLAGVPKFRESQCRPEVATFLLQKLLFLGLILVFSKSYFFATLVLCVFRKATFFATLVFVLGLCLLLFAIFPESTFWPLFGGRERGCSGGGGCPKVVSRCFSRCVVVCVFLFLAVWSECCLSMPLFAKVWSECCLLVFFVDSVWAMGGCRGLCRFPVRRGDWSSHTHMTH